MMPKFYGLKVLKAIREVERKREIVHEKRVKIILTTALDQTLIAKKSLECDYDSYISKPIMSPRNKTKN